MRVVKKRLLNLVFLAAAGALAGFLLFWQVQSSDEEQKAKEEQAKVLDIAAPDDVQALRLETPKGTFVLTRQTGVDGASSWQIKEPLVTAAEDSTIDGIVRALVELRRSGVVGKKDPNGHVMPPKELFLFALEPPRIKVTLTDKAGVDHVLLVGKKNTFDGTIYVKRQDAPDVMQVPGNLEYQVDRDLYALRDKRVAVFEPEAVEKMVVERPKGEGNYTVERKGEGFWLRSPLDVAADSAQVEGALSALANIRARSFETEKATPDNLARWGLDKPSVRVQLFLKGRDEPLVILLNEQKIGDTTRYSAMQEGEHPILELGSEWAFKKVALTPASLRDLRVLVFDRDAVTKLTLARADSTVVLEKRDDPQKERGTWTVASQDGVKAQDATVTGLLYRLSSLKARRVASEDVTAQKLAGFGLDPPDVTITLAGKDGAAMGSVAFSKDKDGERFAHASDSQRVDVVDASIVNDFSFDAKDYVQAAKPE